MSEHTASPQQAWQVMGASVTGTSHLRQQRTCEDAHAYEQKKDNFLCLAVADGAGTASYAAQGAQEAIQATLSTARAKFYEQEEFEQEEQVRQTLSEMTVTIRQMVEARIATTQTVTTTYLPSDALSLSLREYATTLLCVVVTTQWLATLQIGDGAIVIQHSNGKLESLSSPSTSEYINETHFLTDDDFLSHVAYKVLPRKDIHRIALLTDGLQMLAMNFPANSPFPSFFLPLFNMIDQSNFTEHTLQTFLASERVNIRTDDDKTLILAVQQVQQ